MSSVVRRKDTVISHQSLPACTFTAYSLSLTFPVSTDEFLGEITQRPVAACGGEVQRADGDLGARCYHGVTGYWLCH
ncbi:Carnitine monooxygenase reductase subunit [Fusarium oxysporum f. sp. albedinis]|nr:Carnitine monooxygenase reductase subunit [Fusarium oxysporum f. sp. albedinis]